MAAVRSNPVELEGERGQGGALPELHQAAVKFGKGLVSEALVHARSAESTACTAASTALCSAVRRYIEARQREAEASDGDGDGPSSDRKDAMSSKQLYMDPAAFDAFCNDGGVWSCMLGASSASALIVPVRAGVQPVAVVLSALPFSASHLWYRMSRFDGMQVMFRCTSRRAPLWPEPIKRWLRLRVGRSGWLIWVWVLAEPWCPRWSRQWAAWRV